MSLITRCPACATMFKVVPDQLRISDGWVRCGHCAEVFDAALQLQPLEAVAAATVPAPLPEDTAQEPPAPAPVIEPVQALPDEQAAWAREAASSFEPTRGFAGEGEGAAVDDGIEPSAGAGPVMSAPELLLQPAAATPTESTTAQVSPPQPEPSFVRDARRKAFWRSRGLRALMALAALVLLLALGLQWAVQQRDWLAAAEPRLRPWLASLCAPVQCHLAPPRQIEAVVIDSSSFSKLGADAFRLSLTLRNSAAMEVATPALELTLTDMQDQAVLRRVLHPAELGAPPALAAAGEWSASTAMTVDANGGAARIAGYRLIAFYP